jgi:hypothetical protein
MKFLDTNMPHPTQSRRLYSNRQYLRRNANLDSFISSSCGKCFSNSINDSLRRDESCGKDDALIGSFSLCTINRLKHGTDGDVGIIDCEIEGGLFGCEKISSSLFGELLDLRFAILMD